jgi:hypothetical protein
MPKLPSNPHYDRLGSITTLSDEGAAIHVRFTPKADKRRTFRYVRLVPLATERSAAKAPLFDHLVGGYEQAGRDGQAERLCRFEVDDQLELDRGLDGKLARLFRPLGYDRHRWPRAENCHCCRFRTIVIRRL